MKIFKRILITLLIVVAIASVAFATIQTKKISSLEEKVSYEPIHIGHIDIENGLIYVGCKDLIYGTSVSETACGMVWDILPECMSMSLPEYFDGFYNESFGISLPYQAVSRSGRFLVETLAGNTYWVEPSAREYLWTDDDDVISAVEKAFASAHLTETTTKSE